MPCPAPLKGFVPRAVQSPSAIRAYATCPRMWGYESLEGRRTPNVDYFDLPAKPEKPAKGASAVDEARYKKALKAYNKAMRPAQGTTLHAVWEAYYLQNTPGAWHAPMVWRTDLAELWHSRPGQIALSGRQHLPDPKSLADVWVEELVSLDLGFLPGGWPQTLWVNPHLAEVSGSDPLLIGGTPDLVTMRHVEALYPDEPWSRLFHLYDYKSTVSIDDYAKTAEELLEDEQAAIYSLAVMQKHGLAELACTWLYFQTDDKKPARSLPVHFTMTRTHAEAVVARIAQQATAMAETQARYLAEKPGLLGGRLKVIQALDTNDMACDNFAGCAFHAKRGGICTPRKSSFGEALNKVAAEKKKTTARREASKAAKAAQKESRAIDMNATERARMATLLEEKAALPAGTKLVFAKAQELLKLEKLAAAEAEAMGDTRDEAIDKAAHAEDVETTGEEAPAEKPAKAEPTKPKSEPQTLTGKPKAAPSADGEALTPAAVVRAFEGLPKTSPLYKGLLKVIKAEAALEAARAGE